MVQAPAPMPIRRKPVAAPETSPYAASSRTEGPEFDERPPPLPARPPQPRDRLRPGPQPPGRPVSRGAEPLLQVPHDRGLRAQRSMPELSRAAADSSPLTSSNAAPVLTAATFGPVASADKRNFVQSALSEARHFAGGLIPHPTESTKHYTILRHSPALIFYRGPSTSVAITIFSSPDHPLPADRTLWLQQRGFSGDSGMKIKAFFNATDDWLHVTPSTQVLAHQLPADTDRAWQRDIANAAKKLLKEKGPKKAHIPRETHVIRIPEASEDGYFRLILCTGRETPYGTNETSSKRKTLCTSPIFRIVSTSSDSSVFRGASLSSLPLEMGVYVVSMVATTTIDRYVAPVRDPVQAAIDRVRPGTISETVGGLVRDEMSERSAERDAERDQAFFTAHQAHVTRSLEADPNTIHPIGPASGPEPPFPIKFRAKVARGTGRSQAELGIPTANLSGVPDEIQYRLNGVYFGWACVQPKNTDRNPSTSAPPLPQWHETIITISPNPSVTPSVTPKPLVTAHLLNYHPSHNTTSSTTTVTTSSPTLINQTLTIILLGLLRPNPTPTTPPLPLNARLDAAARDACLALVSLARENWRADSPAVTEGLARTNSSSLGERVESVKERVMARMQTATRSVPLHWVGVRSGVGEERDRVLGVGGYWVAR